LNWIKMRKFCLQMVLGFTVIGTLFFLRHKSIYPYVYSLGGIFFLGYLAPPLGKRLHFIWMKLAFVIEWVVTRFIMAAIFYLVFTPLGWCIRLFGKDLLDRKIEKEKKSYWKEKPKHPFHPRFYERQF
jgi:predicted membrane protein